MDEEFYRILIEIMKTNIVWTSIFILLNHPSFSRKCQFIIDPKTAKQQQRQISNSKEQPSKHEQSTAKSYASAVSGRNSSKSDSQPAALDIQTIIKEQVEASLRNMMDELQLTIKAMLSEQLQIMSGVDALQNTE